MNAFKASGYGTEIFLREMTTKKNLEQQQQVHWAAIKFVAFTKRNEQERKHDKRDDFTIWCAWSSYVPPRKKEKSCATTAGASKRNRKVHHRDGARAIEEDRTEITAEETTRERQQRETGITIIIARQGASILRIIKRRARTSTDGKGM